MKVVLQRVSEASVHINQEEVASIQKGLLLFLGVVEGDTSEDIHWLCNKIVHCRIFPDEAQVMNRSILQNEGDIIVVSQFTLHANTKKGHRPSYNAAAKPEVAIPIYKAFIKQLEKELGKPIKTGEFGADMKVQLVNDGPVTIIIDTEHK